MKNNISTAAALMGSARTAAKAAAARENGAKGGRPLTLTGGKRGFIAAIDEAFTTPTSNPTIRYSHARGFHVESGLCQADEDVLWSALAYYDLNSNGRRSVRPVDYPEVREAILDDASEYGE
jgi:hypothetical protein